MNSPISRFRPTAYSILSAAAFLAAGVLSTPAHAVILQAPSIGSNVSSTSNNGQTTYNYSYTLSNPLGLPIGDILIPLYQQRDAQNIITPGGWNASIIPNGAAGAGWIDQNNGDYFDNPSVLLVYTPTGTFTGDTIGLGFSSFYAGTEAPFQLSYTSALGFTEVAIIDPPIPNDPPSVPEPASLILFASGLAALGLVRLRGKFHLTE